MVAAYSIRRLLDSDKLSSRLPAKRFPVRVHPLKGRAPMRLDRSADELYDLEGGNRSELDLVSLYNEIIHSFIFQLFVDDAGGTSVAVASDRTSKKHLYLVSVEVLADLFDYVGREDIVKYHGWMRSRRQESARTSNHDLVEEGLASYVDDDRVFTDWHEDRETTLEALLPRLEESSRGGGDPPTATQTD